MKGGREEEVDNGRERTKGGREKEEIKAFSPLFLSLFLSSPLRSTLTYVFFHFFSLLLDTNGRETKAKIKAKSNNTEVQCKRVFVQQERW